MMSLILFALGVFIVIGGFMRGDAASIIGCLFAGAAIIGFGVVLLPIDIQRPHRRSTLSSARIIGGDTIEVTNLDDVDAAEMSRWHVSSLKIRERTGRSGNWIYHFQYMGQGVVEDTNDPLHKEAMRHAEKSLNDFIGSNINPKKGGNND